MADPTDFQMQQQMQSMQPKKRDFSTDLQEVSEVVRDTSGRMRVIEERYSSLRKILQVTEQNALKTNKDVHESVKLLTDEVSELKSQLSEIKDEMKLIISELKATAKKEDVEMLDKYINLWEPLNFVTQRDVDIIVKRALENAMHDKKQ
ncbi:hypothetical protein J4232_05215 [Candidatus Woesearchaeota archaeon]|nr:hypothetical protein [Candidatus Woesearchaeota archaeon]